MRLPRLNFPMEPPMAWEEIIFLFFRPPLILPTELIVKKKKKNFPSFVVFRTHSDCASAMP
jgi:hypothetical protein